MTRKQVHDLMENELRCVQRGNYCDRDCAKCPLVKDDKELIEAYSYVIKALEQEPVLDKIRAEVENINVWGMRYNPDTDKDIKPQIVQKVKEHVIEIIDNYKAERIRNEISS